MGNILTAQQRSEFQQNGFVVISGFYNLPEQVLPIQQAVYDLIGKVMERHGVADRRNAFDPQDFDLGYQALIALDRTFGSEVYDAVKHIPSFLRIVADPRHEQIFREVYPNSVPGTAVGSSGIRIDNPHEQKFLAPWHQEYPAQLRSPEGLVFWSPLVPVTPEIGPLKFYVGSHREGLIPVFTTDPKNPDKSGAYSLILNNEVELADRYPLLKPLTEPGDLVLLNYQVVHSSSPNLGDRSLWSMQMRYFNFAEPIGMQYGWKGSYAAGIDFRTIHPELCADLDQSEK
jgi:Phytanoyl-CoA dioxygenase (PhyH)